MTAITKKVRNLYKKEVLHTLSVQLAIFINISVYYRRLIVSILNDLVNVPFLLKTELNKDEK